MKNLGIKWRIILPVGIILCLGIGAITIIIANAFSQAMTESVNQRMQETANHYATLIEVEMASSLGGVRALASVYEKAAGTSNADRSYYIDVMSQVLKENDDLFAVWACFEPNAFDGKDAEYVNNGGSGAQDEAGQDKLRFVHDKSGRYIPYNYILDNGQVSSEPLTDYDKPGDGDYYLAAKNSRHEIVSNASYYAAGSKNYYVAAVTVPIIDGDRVLGASGGDIHMTPICEMLKEIKLFDTGYLMVIDDSGFLVYSPNENDWGRDAKGKLSMAAYNDALEVSKTGQTKHADAVEVETNQRVISALAPIKIGKTGQAWVIRVVVPYDEAMAPVKRGVIITIVTGAAVLLISLILLYWQVAAVARVLNSLSGRLFNASSSVSQAASSISETSNSLAEGATEQAASLEETSAALEEMSSMTRQNAENASKTSDGTRQVTDLVQVCNDNMQRMSDAMDDINDKSEKISRIIKAIEDITFQTNLLALNAAVEAARAGDAGKGFAVVADEVRNLSQRSAQAAKDTPELIGGTVDSVRHGAEIVSQLAENFQKIETGANRTANLISEIATATNEQAQGVEQVNIAVAQMDKVTQQNAANAQEAASVTRELSSQAEELDQVVEELINLVSGQKQGSSAKSDQATEARERRLMLS